MTTQNRIMYILMPFLPQLDPVKHALKEVAEMTGFIGMRSDEVPRGGDLIKTIIEGIYKADLIIADLTYLNPNVLYELGVAQTLIKDCLMICQKREGGRSSKPSWVVSQEGEGLGDLPFDLARFDVTAYKNSPEALETLKNTIKGKILQSKGARLTGPVNTALDVIFKRNKTLSYLLWGAGAGAISGVIASTVSAFIGASFIYRYHEAGKFIRTVYEGAPAGVFYGALALATYSIVYNLSEPELRRPLLILSQVIAGFLSGVLIFISLFFVDIQKLGLELAFSIAIPFFIMSIFAGVGMGFSLNIQPERLQPEPFSMHMTKSTIAILSALTAFVGFINIFKNQIFFPAYLVQYELLDSVSDALRVALGGIGISIFQWWLKWGKRL